MYTSLDDNRLHTVEAPTQIADVSEENETETKSAVIMDDNTLQYEQNQPEDLCNNEKKVLLDWNANTMSEIPTGMDYSGDADAVAVIVQEQEAPVCVKSDKKSPSEEAMENHDGMTNSAAVAVVTASATDTPNDDAVPPLPSSLPPPSSDFPPSDHDTSQEQSVLVEEQYHNGDLGEEKMTDDKYSVLSEEERLLVQRILFTTEQHQVSGAEETMAAEHEFAGDHRDSESDQKYSDLSESDSKLIENMLATLSKRQPDVLAQKFAEEDSDDRNTGKDGLSKEDASSVTTRIQESSLAQDHEADKDLNEGVEGVSVGITLEHEMSTSEPTVVTDQIEGTAASVQDALMTSEPPVGNPINSHNDEQTAVGFSEINETEAPKSEELDSANHLISNNTVSPDDVIATKDYESVPVDDYRENCSEPTVVVQLQVNVDEAPETEERSTADATELNGKSTDDVFHASSSDNVASDTRSNVVETDVMSKSRRTLLSDEAASGVLRDYYTADADVEEKVPEKPKPLKPLIAQALLPKASRHAVGTVAAVISSRTSTGFVNRRPSYGQVEIPKEILSETSEASATQDDQRSKPTVGQDGDASGNSVPEAVQGSDVSVEKSTNSDAELKDDSHKEPTIAESRAFFKSREAALKNGSDKSFPIQTNPVTESSSVNFTQVTSSKTEDGDTRTVQASLAQASQGNSAGSRQPARSLSTPLETIIPISQEESQATDGTASTSSLSMSPKVETETPTMTDSRMFFESIGNRSGYGGDAALKSRAPLTTRWAPKPFSLTTTTAKSTPHFVTFEPVPPAGNIPETTKSDVPKDSPVEVAKVESSTSSKASVKTATESASKEPKLKWNSVTKTSDANGSEKIPETTKSDVPKDSPVEVAKVESTTSSKASVKTVSESASKEPKLKWNSVTKTTDANGSVRGSSATGEGEWKSKSNDVKTDVVGSVGVADASAMPEKAVVEPQLPHDRHPPMSATAMAAELKKKRTTSLSGSSSAKPVGVGVGRSFSVTHVDAQPKAVSGSKTTSRSPSWTKFDYRKTVLPTQVETASSTVGGQETKTSTSGVDQGTEHISAASSKAFFKAAELAEKQALNQSGAGKHGKKYTQTSRVKVVSPATDVEKSLTAAEIEPTSSKESSLSTHSTPVVMPRGK